MSTPEPSNYFEYIIRDADSYGAVLSEANLEISQLEPGCLSGRHVRLGLPGGQFSYAETSKQLRGNGTFSNLWTLSVILGSTTRSRQHGIEVRAGSLVIHRPGVEHDGVYGRNFKVTCFTVSDEVLAKLLPQLHPHVQDAMRRPWSVFEPPANSRQKIIEHFAEGAAIIQSDPQVRNSLSALAKFEEELVGDFLDAVEQQLPRHSNGAEQRAAAMVREIDQYVHKSRMVDSSVAELCTACEVPRRTLNRAFQSALGMGPATYLRCVRLNGVRRALQQRSSGSTTVTDVALEFGFWHLGRFAAQYHELFGESPHETLRRQYRGIAAA
ncbi:MAG: helix-turn-helix domain-containing protein [Acidobacteriota bacterium]|nr:helix-turn-helix domain-containing protein [Acidobacteriota bacterium]